MKKVGTNIRVFFPHRKRRVTSAQRGLARGPRAVVLTVMPASPSGRAHSFERSRSRVASALAASVVLHGIALACLLYVASVPPVGIDSDKRIAVELVDQVVASPLVQAEPSRRPDVGSRQQTRKQVRRPHRVNHISQAVATSAPTPLAEKSERLPMSLPPSDEATIPATAAVATTARVTNVAGTVPWPAVQASPAQATSVTNAEIESRLRAATPGCYPYAAIRANLEGVTKLGFCVGESGQARRVQIVQSSGVQLLDSAALDCILPAAMPFPPAKDLCVTVPIRFQLRP